MVFYAPFEETGILFYPRLKAFLTLFLNYVSKGISSSAVKPYLLFKYSNNYRGNIKGASL